MNDFGFGTQPAVDPLGEVDPLTGLRKPVGMPLPQRQQIEDEATKKALVQSLRNTKDWMGSQFSLDSPKNPSGTAMAADALISATPVIGQVTAARDVERAHRDNDPVAGGLAALGLNPVSAIAGLGAKTALMAGVRALRAPKNLHQAELAEHIGEDSWKHGWFRGLENHEPWKWEIPDKDMKLKVGTSPQLDGTHDFSWTGNLSEAVHHPKAYENYPHLQNVQTDIKIHPDFHNDGGYNAFDNAIRIRAKTPEDARLLLLHEMQHGVQEVEGFSNGSNPQVIAKALRDARKETGTPPSTGDNKFAEKMYLNNMGEKEARIVPERADWTPEQLARVNPLSQMGDPDKLFDLQKTIDAVVKRSMSKDSPVPSRPDWLAERLR
jgi:hypothetical protein